jgi:hypothetical protein
MPFPQLDIASNDKKAIERKGVKMLGAGNIKGGSIIVTLTSCLTGLESAV